MSVLVNGMKMPDSCYHCKIAECCGHYIANYTDRRHPDCPLVALPDKHGRLGDLDELIEQMEADAEHMDEPYAKMMYYAAISDVRHAPTIVDSEGENANHN